MKYEKYLKFGAWAIALVGGLAHVWPSQLAPYVSYAVGPVTVQMVAGGVIVLLALSGIMKALKRD